MSMGAHGSLKIAFRHPDRFAAVCGLNPMIEPGFDAEDAPARNRFFYPPGLPAALVGRNRDKALYASNHPPRRARDNAAAIRDSALAIYLTVGGDDALNAHDGAEFLHRVLWDLDIAHDYHLVAGADHIGPGLADRLRHALMWLGGVVDPSRGFAGPGGFSHEAVAGLRAQLAPLREQAAATDPTVPRRYGILPSTR
jgi:S-formylglutathione hydrolase